MDTNNTNTISTNDAAVTKPAEQAVQGSAQPTPSVPEIPTTANTPPPAAQTTDSGKDIFAEFALKIIKEQEGIIGPIAYEQASKVSGLSLDPKTHAVTLTGDKKLILENLVKQYELLFGRVSIEICKEAVRSMITQAPTDQVPQILL